jgi:hypothetical protein
MVTSSMNDNLCLAQKLTTNRLSVRSISMQAFRALIAAAPALRSLPFTRSIATRTFAALGPKAGAPASPAAPKPAASPATALASKPSTKASGPFAGIFSRKSAPRKVKAAPPKKKTAAGKVLVKRRSKYSTVLARKPKVAAKSSTSVPMHPLIPPSSFSYFIGRAPVAVKNAVKVKSALETSRRYVVAGSTGKKAAIRVPNDPLRMSGIKFLRTVKHKLIAGRSKTLKLSERTQVELAAIFLP